MALAFLVWLSCFALSVDDAVRETAYDPVLVVLGAAEMIGDGETRSSRDMRTPPG